MLKSTLDILPHSLKPLWLLVFIAACARPDPDVTAQVKSAAEVKSTDWPQFRGPTGQGISKEKNLPLTWSAKENLAWKLALPGAGASAPIVVGERVYVTCYSGFNVPGQPKGEPEQLKRHLLCVSLTTGKLDWQKDMPATLPESPRVRDHGYAASTPASDGERLYVFFGKSGLFCFDLNGDKLWQADVGSKHHEWGSASSPVLHGDLVIVNAAVESDSLIAFNKKTGKEVWRAKGMRESWNTPVFATLENGKTELVVAIQGKVLGFDPATGDQLWWCATDIGWYMVPSIVTDKDMVYCIGGRSGVAGLAVRAGGKGDVTRTNRTWTSKKGSNVSSPIYHEGHLYWLNDSLETALCAEAATGKVVYEERIQRAGQFYASPVLADGKLYCVSRNSGVYVLAASPKFEKLAHNTLDDRSIFDASPAVSAGRLLLRSDRFLYCIGK